MSGVFTTLNDLRKHNPCEDSWRKMLRHLGKTRADDEPLAYTVILDVCGLDDALWALRARPDIGSLWRHFAVDCAEDVRHLMTDARSVNALDVARRHADGKATDGELDAARDAAWYARDAARAAAWEKQASRLRDYFTLGARPKQGGEG